jgi:hypothetical protein
LRQKRKTDEKLFLDLVSLLKAFDAAGSIDELLLAGKEGMTLRTNFHGYFFQGGARLDLVAAGARYRGKPIFGVYILFHQ